MAFNTSSFFTGVGTVVLTIAVGFGGGVLMTDAFVGKQNRESNKLEQRATEKPDAVRTIATSVAPVSEAKAAEGPAPTQQSDPQQQPVRQPTPQAQPTIRESYAQAPDADVRKERQRLDRLKRAEERRLKAAERMRKEQRAIARARQGDRQREREELRQPMEQAAQTPAFSPFNLND
jgi:flagellar biosynthesis GTPase FlhF